MKLFQRIFATFCTVIICAIFVASFSFRLVQEKIAENRFEQQRAFEATLLRNAVAAFNSRGEQGVRELLLQWQDRPEADNVLVIAGDDYQDIFKRPVAPDLIEAAYRLALSDASSPHAHLKFDRFGQEYLFFIRNWDKREAAPLTSPLFIPDLPLSRVWQEILILGFIVVVGLLLAFILANNIAKPIGILGRGMNRLAAGELDTRIAQHMHGRDDELSQLALLFDRMALQLKGLVSKERDLLHHVSHEMRSPLARIQAILGLIQAQPHKQEQYLARLENELVRMDTLVGELLTLSRLETANAHLDKEKLKLIPFLLNLVEDSQAVAQSQGQSLSFACEKVPQDISIEAHESYLYRALDNVIRNAMNYSPPGSKIDVVLRQDAKNWLIEIVDNGPGVDELQLAHIFTAFYRADSSANRPGTGLGLALAKHIIDRHDGKIIAENVQPNGLKMTFSLPKKPLRTVD